ncbi:DUF742 domain-containing protein [Streptomyces sp. SID9124]|uniref:DUF742 domain-containing protein n=1 Tax=Streptomyces sp. SID9124 TaxID=2706108 RepID=UPI0013DFDFF8|nr:DUF742 domain-containing protein [Streptomyces sp. SID9124]
MGTPPGGHRYDGDRHVPGEHGDERFNFPSTPGRQGAQQPQQPYRPYGQPQYGQAGHDDWPQQEPQQPAQQPHHPRRPHRFDAPQQQPRIQPVQPRRAPEPAAPAAHNPLVRPYAMTGGRTRPRYQLAIEALVSTTADPSRLQGQLPEHQRICRLCFEIKSVAEISALLSIPLGVARILVADLAEAGLVAIHQPGGDESAGGQPDVTLLERVLSGLRKL